MRELFRRLTKARRARAAAFDAAVKAEADRLVQWKRGDTSAAWWLAQELLRGSSVDRSRRRLLTAARDELDSRIPRIARTGPDTATRMLWRS